MQNGINCPHRSPSIVAVHGRGHGLVSALAASAPLPALATSNERVDVLMRELATLKDRMNQLEQNSYVGDSIDLDDSFDGEVNLDEEEDAPPTHVLARR